MSETEKAVKPDVLNDDFDFDNIARQEKDVKYGGKTYTLREATSDAVVEWRNAQMNNVTFVDGKPKSMGQIARIQPMLVSLCLTDADGKRVPESEVKSWPERYVAKMYQWIMTVSELNLPATDAEVKNV